MPRRSKRTPGGQPTLFEIGAVASSTLSVPSIARFSDKPGLFLGTSAFTAAGWPGTFYPAGMKSTDYLAYYASQFRTVEIDSTYYGTPSESAVANWYRKTPADFIFAAKIPQIVTHTKVLVNCEPEFDEFIARMSLLGEKLGPLLFQFPHFDKYELSAPEEFLRRLRLFLKRTSEMYKLRFVVEVRNTALLNARLADLLGEYKVALALTDLSYMPRPWEFAPKFDPITADFTYVRWLGNRKGIEAVTQSWDKLVVDRRDDLRKWAELFRHSIDQHLQVYTYANNHYAGNGPQTITLFRQLLKRALENLRSGGGGGSRTPVRKALRHGAYMLISVHLGSPAAIRTSKKRSRLVRWFSPKPYGPKGSGQLTVRRFDPGP